MIIPIQGQDTTAPSRSTATLSDVDRTKVFETNARRVYPGLDARLPE